MMRQAGREIERCWKSPEYGSNGECLSVSGGAVRKVDRVAIVRGAGDSVTKERARSVLAET